MGKKRKQKHTKTKQNKIKARNFENPRKRFVSDKKISSYCSSLLIGPFLPHFAYIRVKK